MQSSAAVKGNEPPFPSPGYAWYVVIILYLAYTLSFVDRQIIAFLVGPIRAALNVSDFEFSLIHGMAFVVFYTIMGIPLGRLADSRNRRGIITIGIAIWSFMTTMCGVASTYVQLFLARIGVGVGEAALSPAAYSIISDSFPKEKRSLPISIYSAGVLCGAGLANVFGGLIVDYALKAGAVQIPVFGTVQPWQLAFILVGLPGILIVLLMATVREPLRREKATAGKSVPFSATLAHGRKYAFAYLTVIFGATFFATTNFSLMSWVPSLFERSYGWSRAQTGPMFGGIIFIGGTIGLAAGGWLANRMIRAGNTTAYSRIMIWTQLLTIPALALLVAVDNPYWTMSCIAFIVLFLSTHVGLAPSAISAITPNEMRGQVIAFYFFLLNLIGMTGGTSGVAAFTDFYFHNDLAVGKSISVVATIASTLGVLTLILGLKAYRKAAEEIARQ